MKFDEIKNLDESEKEALFNKPEELKEYVKASMSERRYEHSLNVANTARMLAECNEINPEKAYLAGLLHDICKEMDKDKQLAVLAENDPEKMDYPIKAIHGYTARYYLKSIYERIDEEVLDAIYNHTICEKKTALNMIIYIADKREPGRGLQDDILELAKVNLEEAYHKLVLNVEVYLKEQRNEKCIRSCL